MIVVSFVVGLLFLAVVLYAVVGLPTLVGRLVISDADSMEQFFAGLFAISVVVMVITVSVGIGNWLLGVK